MVVSQYGDEREIMESGESVQDFVRRYLGFERGFLGVVALVNVAIAVVFALVFAISIRVFNFQKR